MLNLYWTTVQNGSIQMDSCHIHHNANFSLLSTVLFKTYSTLLSFALPYHDLSCSSTLNTTLFYCALQHSNNHNRVTVIPCSVTDSWRIEAHLVFRQNSHKVLQNNLPPNYLAESTEKYTFIIALMRGISICIWLNSWELYACQLLLSLLSNECVVVWD